jgi:hypothetical protein
MKNAAVYRLAAALTIIGVLLFAIKWQITGLPLSAGKLSNAWQVESDISFRANGGSVRASVFIPATVPGMQLHDLRLVGSGYGTLVLEGDPNTVASFTKREARGEQSIHVRFILQLYPERQDQLQHRRSTPLGSADGPATLRHPALSETETTAARDILNSARSQSADDLSMVQQFVKMMTASPPSDQVRQLLGASPHSAAVAEKAVAALRLGKFDARLVHGVDVAKPRRTAPLVTWFEVKFGERWRAFPAIAGAVDVPITYVAWWRGADPLVRIEGGQTPTRRISVKRLQEVELNQVLIRGRHTGSPFIEFSLYSLPTSTQQLYRILFMIPIGVFMLVILRNFVGIKGLGTFMPVLIALAFRETTLPIGIGFFVAIIAIGLLTRLYLDHLKLLVAPRLAVILIVVILSMALISIVTHKLGFDRGLSIALFPIVILTMTIERVSIIWDERGPSDAIWEAVQSLIIASVCYFVMTLEGLQYLIFTFPEINLILLAAILVIGRYSGYRLLELVRFRSIVEDAS